MNDFYEIKESLNRASFMECENVFIGDVLHYPLLGGLDRFLEMSKIKRLLVALKWKLCIIIRLFISYYDFVGNRKSNCLFLFSSSYGYREEMKDNFNKVYNLTSNSSAAVYNIKNKSYSLWKVKYIFVIKSWEKTLRANKVPVEKEFYYYILLSLVNVFFDYKDIEKHYGSGFENINILISWCDCHAVDSFFTQKFNNLDKVTVDLMHGSIGSNIDPWDIDGIKSSVFIADSQYTVDLLNKHNYKGRIFICGYPYDIDLEECDTIKKKQYDIGVFLSHISFKNENEVLLKEIATLKNLNLTFVAKYHPTDTPNNYVPSLISPFVESYTMEKKCREVLNNVKYAIISPSTVVYEAIYNKIPFLFVADKMGAYKSYGIPSELIISGDDFEMKIIKMMNGDYTSIYEELRNYFVPPGNVKRNFLDAFINLGINIIE